MSLFHAADLAILLIYGGLIGLLLAADIWYVNMKSFGDALSSPDIRSSFMLSIVTSIITTILAVLVAVPSAYALSRLRFRGAGLVDALIDMSIVLPPIVVGLSVLVLFRMGLDMSESDWTVLRLVGRPLKWFMDLFIHEVAGIVLIQFVCSATFALRAIKAAFDELDPRSEQVALTLGCTRWQAFRMVMLPSARPGITAGAVLAWARAIGIFGPVMIVAGAVRGRTEVLPTSVYLEISVGRIEAALAISLLMVMVSLVVLSVFRATTSASLFGGGNDRAARGGGQ